ncbi:MAG: KilA-N domain-containing protein [Opitutales bacterium]|nr:KilA-N domain-containing protein [Opitutales bacterium]
MSKINKLTVRNVEISLLKVNDEDYICLTDMVKNEDGDDHIRNWMRNRNTVEYLGIWEQLNNPNFKGVEFDTFKKQAGLNSFSATNYVLSTDTIWNCGGQNCGIVAIYGIKY